MPKNKTSNTFSIIALVLSCLFFIPLAPLAGLIMGIFAVVKKYGSQGLAIAAIIIGGLFLLLNIIFMIGLAGLILGFSKAMAVKPI